MWHVTCMQRNRGNSQFLMVGIQIGNLTRDPCFDQNLCLKCPNGSCEPILDIYIPRAFQWYNPMGFDPYNRFLKIRESIEILTPKVGAHLGVWGFIPSHSPTFLGAWYVTFSLHTWPAPSQALTLVVSPRLGLRQISNHGENSIVLHCPCCCTFLKKSWSWKHHLGGQIWCCHCNRPLFHNLSQMVHHMPFASEDSQPN